MNTRNPISSLSRLLLVGVNSLEKNFIGRNGTVRKGGPTIQLETWDSVAHERDCGQPRTDGARSTPEQTDYDKEMAFCGGKREQVAIQTLCRKLLKISDLRLAASGLHRPPEHRDAHDDAIHR